MAVGQGLGHLLDVLAGPGLVKFASLALLQAFVHFSTRGVLEDQVDFSLVKPVSKETQDVGMSEDVKCIVYCTYCIVIIT